MRFTKVEGKTLVSWLARLREEVRRQRRHAPFFSWHDRSAEGKSAAEAGVVQSLFGSMAAAGGCPYSHLRSSGERWPDCEAEDPEGGQVAIEVTELVDSNAFNDSFGAKPWSEERVISQLLERILDKDQKSFHGQQYAEVILIIHTDEFYLSPLEVVDLVGSHEFGLTHGNLDRAFLLFSYLPEIGRCPFTELRLSLNAAG